MIRDGFEKGLSSLVARWMLDGSAESVLERVAKSGALPPEQVEKLRQDTLEHLQKVRDDGAPYADMATAALRELLGHVPLAAVVSGAAAAASETIPKAAGPAAQAAARMALNIAAKSASAAAARASELAEKFAPAKTAAADTEPEEPK